jgi:protein-disulfide isomerase
MAAQDQGKFWEMHDYLFEHQDLEAAHTDEAARAIGLNLKRFEHSLSQAHAAEIDADIAEAARLGARGTPTFFVNGQPIAGAQSIEIFRKTIEAERDKAQALLDRGVPLQDLYDKTLEVLPAP